jgi:hypothetical protein
MRPCESRRLIHHRFRGELQSSIRGRTVFFEYQTLSRKRLGVFYWRGGLLSWWINVPQIFSAVQIGNHLVVLGDLIS